MNAAQEEARRRMVAFRDDMVSQGWTLVRDNEAGGALVIEQEGNRVVVSMHGYEVKETAADLIKEYEAANGEITDAEMAALDTPETLEPSPGNDAEPTEKVTDEAVDA